MQRGNSLLYAQMTSPRTKPAMKKILLSLMLPFLAYGELNPNIHLNGGTLNNAHVTFEQQKTGHVAFLGGSITKMNGYRPMMVEALAKRFPDT